MFNLPDLPGNPGAPSGQALNEDDEEALMDAYLEKIKNEYKDGWTEDNWEEVR
jgi:hypothetical protein